MRSNKTKNYVYVFHAIPKVPLKQALKVLEEDWSFVRERESRKDLKRATF